MVATELLEELSSICRNFDWHYDGKNRKIRGTLKSQPDRGTFDPIGAVCYAKTGVTLSENEWLRAAELLKLSHIAAGDLTAAANNVPTGPGQVYTRNLRRQMIDGVLLQPESAFVLSSDIVESTTGHLPAQLRTKAHGGAKLG